MLYDFLFKFLDSIPTISFLVWFLFLLVLVYHMTQTILLKSLKYSVLSHEKQSAILCNILEVMVLVFITYIALIALWRKDVNIIDTANHKQNPQIMINIATMYTMKDVVDLVFNKKIARTTIIHHLCVIMAYLHVLRVLTTDFNVEGVFKCFIGYAVFTTFNFPYKVYLALRFFIDRSGSLNSFCKRFAFFHKMLCVSVNFSWQTFYFIKLLTIFYYTGSSVLTLLLSCILYTVLMAGWIREECVVVEHLRRP